jgi:hypothetical protein
MATVLTEAGEFTVAARDGLRLGAADAERVTGWTWKPEGMCRDDVCVPLPAAATRDGTVDVAAFWQLLGQPVLHDDAGETWVLGTGAAQRASTLAGLAAPDVELADFDGTTRRLSTLRGKKVFLTTWSSW